MNIHHITNIAVLGDELAIVYGDHTEDYIPLEKVRKCCPCAVCQGEPDVLGRVVKQGVQYTKHSFSVTKIEFVGGYALQFFWQDGHSTGIYSYDYLRLIARSPAG